MIDAVVNIPETVSESNKILLEGTYGLFSNLPHVDAQTIAGHACISLVALFKYLCCLGVPIGYAETPTGKSNFKRSSSKGQNIIDTKAMKSLLSKMRKLNHSNKPTYYGYFMLWSDGFIRSYVCQRKNNVWILTITFPDPMGSETSPYHTHCLAIGTSSQDHTPVIDCYMNEVNQLMKGVKIIDGIDEKRKHV